MYAGDINWGGRLYIQGHWNDTEQYCYVVLFSVPVVCIKMDMILNTEHNLNDKMWLFRTGLANVRWSFSIQIKFIFETVLMFIFDNGGYQKYETLLRIKNKKLYINCFLVTFFNQHHTTSKNKSCFVLTIQKNLTEIYCAVVN